MILNKLYEYPTSTRAAINSLRHYSINGSNAKLPSVTTILSQTQSEDKAASLQRWRDQQVRKLKLWRTLLLIGV